MIDAACSSDPRPARDLLAAEPGLALHDFACACATGRAKDVADLLAANPALANAPQGPLNRAPLLYATFSRLPRLDSAFADGIRGTVKALLDAGADPNASFDHEGWRQVPLYGAAGILGDPLMTEMLIEAGGDPNDCADPDGVGEALYHACEHRDPACAAQLIEAGTHPHVVAYCLGRALNFDNPAMVAMWCAHGVTPSAGNLHQAVARRRSLETIEMLLDAGAPVDRRDEHGVTPLRTAIRWGMTEVISLLIERGASPFNVTDEDQLLGAYLHEQGSRERPSADAVQAQVDAAVIRELLDLTIDGGDLRRARLLLDAGAPLDGDPAAEFKPIGVAAWRGRFELVAEMADRGAKLVFDGGGSAIGAALHGSLNCHDPEGGPTMQIVSEIPTEPYRRTIEALIAAGAVVPERLIGDPGIDVPQRLMELGITAG